jgi:hypothetical protein
MVNTVVAFNHACTKDDLNAMLRCDCLARQMYLHDGLVCDQCNDGNDTWHSLVLRDAMTLHWFIEKLTKRNYQSSKLPAYTLQRRCGAIPEYLDRYIEVLGLTEAQTMRTMEYRRKRLKIRGEEDDSQEITATPSAVSTG